MATPSLYVYPLTTQKEVVSLYARVCIGAIRSNQFSLDVRILLTEWNKNTRKTNNIDVNNYINKVAAQLKLIYNTHYKHLENVTKEVVEEIREELVTVLKGKSTKKKVRNTPKNVLTLHQAIDQYIEVLKGHRITEETYKEKKNSLLRIKKFVVETLRINDANKEILAKLFDEMANHNYSHNTIHNSFVVLQQVFEYCIDLNIISENPMKRCNTIYKTIDTPEQISYLTQKDLVALENIYGTLKEKYQTALDLFFFQYETGLAYIDTQTFDYLKHTVEQDNHTFIVKVRHKNRNRRKKTYQKSLLTKKAMEILDKYGKKLPVIKCSNYNQRLRVIAKKAGVKPFSSHVSRKSRATHLLNEGKNENAIKLMLGHSPNSTAIFQHYAHPDLDLLKDLYE
jgi:site-specific recombinase XerD